MPGFLPARRHPEPTRLAHLFRHRTLLDRLERASRLAREKALGVDLSIFAETRAYLRQERGVAVSPEEALNKAMDKHGYKGVWESRPRDSVQDAMEYYREFDTYLFRHPYMKRHGGYRWYLKLVEAVPSPSILEYGCGAASLTEWLMTWHPQALFTIADIPSRTLDFVKWKKAHLSRPYQVVTLPTHSDEIPLSGFFDLIICQDVLEHTPNPLHIVTTFHQHLAPGGVLLLDFLDAVGGPNLAQAGRERTAVKEYLARELKAVKSIDENGTNSGLYYREP